MVLIDVALLSWHFTRKLSLEDFRVEGGTCFLLKNNFLETAYTITK